MNQTSRHLRDRTVVITGGVSTLKAILDKILLPEFLDRDLGKHA